jgi:hypothetical protein
LSGIAFDDCLDLSLRLGNGGHPIQNGQVLSIG